MFVTVQKWVNHLKGRSGLLGVVVLGILTLGFSVFYGLQLLRQPDPETTADEEAIAPVASITALGRIEPLGEVIQLSPPPALGGAKVEQLLVEEGQTVIADQVVAQLDNYDRLQAALDKARQDVNVAESELARVAAGAQTGEIQAAAARIERLQAQRQGEQETALGLTKPSANAAKPRWSTPARNTIAINNSLMMGWCRPRSATSGD